MDTATGSSSGVPVDPKTALITQIVGFNLPQDKLQQILLDDRPNWAWSNMYTYAGADVINFAALNARPALYNFHAIVNMWLILCPIVIASFFLGSHFLRYMPVLKHRYRAIRKEERLIATFHLIFVVVFAIRIVPQSIWTAHLMWGPGFSLQFNNNYKRLWCCAISTALLYTSEGAARSVVRVNPFLVAHHILYFVFFLVPIVRNSVWGSKLILLLDCFIVLSELPLYISLLTHRLVRSTKRVKIITYACLFWSAVMRILELVILISYFAGTYQRMKQWGETQMWGWFLALSIPGGGLVVLFSFGIFWWFLYKRDRDPEKYANKFGELPKTSGISFRQKNSGTSSDDGVRHGVGNPLSVPPKLDP